MRYRRLASSAGVPYCKMPRLHTERAYSQHRVNWLRSPQYHRHQSRTFAEAIESIALEG